MKLLNGIHFYTFMNWLLSLRPVKKEFAASLSGLVASVCFGFLQMGIDGMIHEKVTRFVVCTFIGFLIFRFVFSVCTALAEEYARIRALSIYDTLTGLHNRNYLPEGIALTFTLAQRNEEDFGLLVFDGNKIKRINDTYGHRIGDMAIKEIAREIQKVVYRRHDVIIRLGGDEFVVLFSSSDPQKMYERIKNFFSKGNVAIFVEECKETISLSVAIGMAFAPGTNGTLRERNSHDLYDKLFHEADASMYKNKEEGNQ